MMHHPEGCLEISLWWLNRARKFGWMNNYVFTKAMAEMLAYEHRSRLPIVIVRPTSTTSTLKEPFPGWIEGIKSVS
jgi:fatty acyl-CoA reductase